MFTLIPPTLISQCPCPSAPQQENIPSLQASRQPPPTWRAGPPIPIQPQATEERTGHMQVPGRSGQDLPPQDLRPTYKATSPPFNTDRNKCRSQSTFSSPLNLPPNAIGIKVLPRNTSPLSSLHWKKGPQVDQKLN